MTAAAEGGDGAEGDAAASTHWIFKNKDHGKMSAAASLGAVMLWDVEGGLPAIDRFLYSTDPQVVGGALLAVGIVNSGVQDEVDSALALLAGEGGGRGGRKARGGRAGGGVLAEGLLLVEKLLLLRLGAWLGLRTFVRG